MEHGPSLHELVKARLALVRADLEEAIGRLSDEMLPWSPAEGMRTIRGQLVEIGGTEIQLMAWIREQRQIPYEEAESFSGDCKSVADFSRALERIRSETIEYIDSLSESELDETVAFPERWFEALRLPVVPRSEAFRSLAQHEWYHTGQLVSYLWSRGDDPYKW